MGQQTCRKKWLWDSTKDSKNIQFTNNTKRLIKTLKNIGGYTKKFANIVHDMFNPKKELKQAVMKLINESEQLDGTDFNLSLHSLTQILPT